MGMRIGLVIVVAAVMSSMTCVSGAAPAPAAPRAPSAPVSTGVSAELPTVEQLDAQLAEGKHQEVLRQVARLMGLRGEQAKTYDRYELLRLRGEAALRGKAIPMAIEAFAQAGQATEDGDKRAVARATELLLRRAKPLGYIPRTSAQPAPLGQPDAPAAPAGRAQAPQPIPIIEQADRTRAFAAMFADELAVVAPKVKAASSASALPPVIDSIKAVGDLRAMEIAATGSAARTKEMTAGLGDHAHRLIAQALGPMKTRTEECWQQGSRTRYVEDKRTTLREKLYGMVGLTSTESNDLKSIIATCAKIQPVAAELAAVTERAELLADAQEAQRLHARATEVLTFDYPNEGRYNKPPPAQKTPQKTPQQGAR